MVLLAPWLKRQRLLHTEVGALRNIPLALTARGRSRTPLFGDCHLFRARMKISSLYGRAGRENGLPVRPLPQAAKHMAESG